MEVETGSDGIGSGSFGVQVYQESSEGDDRDRHVFRSLTDRVVDSSVHSVVPSNTVSGFSIIETQHLVVRVSTFSEKSNP